MLSLFRVQYYVVIVLSLQEEFRQTHTI